MVGNLKSVENFLQIVREKIFSEIEEGRISGPFERPPFVNFHILPLGVVPKREQNAYRITHHLSFPKGMTKLMMHYAQSHM